jgi:hypothetical protein
MALSFGITKDEKIMLVQDGRSIADITKLKGYSLLRTIILDEAVNSLSDELRKKGLVLDNTTKKEEIKQVKDKEENPITYLINVNVGLLFLITWLMGIVLAKGKWLVISAIVFPPYGWYLLAESILTKIGLN